MDISSDLLVADVAAIYLAHRESGSFGTGRLIAPGLVLTARHILDFPSSSTPTTTGWRIRFVGERENGTWVCDAHFARVVWRSPDPLLDVALLRLEENIRGPALEIVFASYESAAPLDEVDVVGFPEAAGDNLGNVRDYAIRGSLRIATRDAPFAFTMPPADKPSDPRKWVGMSGSTVGRADHLGRFHIFGVVQEVPAHFRDGKLDIARLSCAFQDDAFVGAVAKALSPKPLMILPWTAASATASQSTGANSPDKLSLGTIRRSIRHKLAQRNRRNTGECAL